VEIEVSLVDRNHRPDAGVGGNPHARVEIRIGVLRLRERRERKHRDQCA
jgi:hypothetical protein